MKKIKIVILLIVLALGVSGCGNQQFLDTTYTFNKAIIEMPGGDIKEINIKSWNDYEGDQLQIKADDGVTYLVHSSKCVMIAE